MKLNPFYSFSLLAILAGCGSTDGQSAGAGNSDAGAHSNGCTDINPTLAAGTKLTGVEIGGLFDTIAVDSTYVYWLDLNAATQNLDLLRVARTGGNRQVLATVDSGGALVADTGSVYVRTAVGISKVSKNGGSPVPFATIDHAEGYGLTQDDARVYAMNEEPYNDDFTCNGQGALFAFDKQTGGKTVLAGNLKCPWGLAVDSDHAYFIVQQESSEPPTLFDRNMALVRVPLAGGTPEVLAQVPLDGSSGIALGGNYAYAVPMNLASFYRIPKVGGAVEKVTPCKDVGVAFIRSGEDGLYINTVMGSYAFAPFDGSPMRSYEGVQDTSLKDFAVDGSTIFEVGDKGVWAITR